MSRDRTNRATVNGLWMRLARAAVLSVLVVAGGVSAVEAAAGPSLSREFPLGHPRCGVVRVFERPTEQWSLVDVFRVSRLSCHAARRVVRQCVDRRTVNGWRHLPFAFTTSLVNGRKKIEVRLAGGPLPRCLQAHALRAPLAGLGATTYTGRDAFGPYQFPMSFPTKYPPTAETVFKWTDPVTTYSAVIDSHSISNLTLDGYVHNPGNALSVWFEYGTTADFASAARTDKQSPKIPGDNSPVRFTARVLHLRAKTRYFWRAAATIEKPDGTNQVVHGVTGSFVTKPYPKLTGNDPCQYEGSFQLTEALTIVCSRRYLFENNQTKYSPFPLSVGYSGSLSCPRDEPRNLNAGSDEFRLPEIGYNLSTGHLVSYWRSNDSNRFTTFPGYQKNSEGLQEGPIPGWHDWNVDQWGYPFSTTETEVQFWINCTYNWTAHTAEQLAAGDGNDSPSHMPPSEPQDVKAVKAPDGGIDVSWKAPSYISTAGVAGYFLTVRGWKPGDPKVLPSIIDTRILVAGHDGHIFPGQLELLKKSVPSTYELGVAVAAVSREGLRGPAAVVDWK